MSFAPLRSTRTPRLLDRQSFQASTPVSSNANSSALAIYSAQHRTGSGTFFRVRSPRS